MHGFAYSDAMRNAGILWTELKPQEYLLRVVSPDVV